LFHNPDGFFYTVYAVKLMLKCGTFHDDTRQTIATLECAFVESIVA